MNTEFEIKIKTMDMYRFLMYHAYHGASGIFSIMAGLVLIAFFIIRREQSDSWMYLLFGVLFLVYLPWTLLNRAAQQVKLGTMFKKPLKYMLSEDGLTVQQEAETAEVAWTDVCRVRETGRSILVYTGKKNAFIWVKAQMGDQETMARQILKAHIPEKNLSLKKA